MNLYNITWDHKDGGLDDDNEVFHTWKAFYVYLTSKWEFMCYKSYYDGMPYRRMQIGPLHISWGLYGEWRCKSRECFKEYYKLI